MAEGTPSPSVGEVIRRYGQSFLSRFRDRLTPTHRKVLGAVAACRTAEMGARVQECDHCGKQVILYNSCNDRHCPTCQGGKRAAWLEARQQELLPVEYFHVVFTAPDELHAIALAHPKTYCDLLFRAVRETLLEIGASGDHLGAEIGGWMMLHTWGQRLELHPLCGAPHNGCYVKFAIMLSRGGFFPVFRRKGGFMLHIISCSHGSPDPRRTTR